MVYIRTRLLKDIMRAVRREYRGKENEYIEEKIAEAAISFLDEYRNKPITSDIEMIAKSLMIHSLIDGRAQFGRDISADDMKNCLDLQWRNWIDRAELCAEIIKKHIETE